MEILLWANIPFEICNTKLELKRVSYIQNSTREFFVTERSWERGEVGLTWIHSRKSFHLLSAKSTVVSIVHLQYVRSNVYTLANGVASLHSFEDHITVWERQVWETLVYILAIHHWHLVCLWALPLESRLTPHFCDTIVTGKRGLPIWGQTCAQLHSFSWSWSPLDWLHRVSSHLFSKGWTGKFLSVWYNCHLKLVRLGKLLMTAFHRTGYKSDLN